MNNKLEETILIVENEVLARTTLAEYLRHCGYRVIEAACAQEVRAMLGKNAIDIHVFFNAVADFALTQWVRKNRPQIHIISAGNMEKAAHAASDLCEKGPHLKKPYQPEQIVEWIKQLKASKPK